MCNSCEFGEERRYDEVNAIAKKFKCDHCGKDL